MFIKYLILILSELNRIHMVKTSSIILSEFLKLKASLKLSVLVSPLLFFVEAFTTWGVANIYYITFVLGAIIIDHLLGTWKHLYIDKDFTIKKNIKGLFAKIIIVILGAYLFEGINHIVEKDTFIKDYLLIVMRLMVFLYPGGSALGNMSIFTKGKFPPKAWIKRLDKFQENLDVEDLTNKKKENE